MNKIIEACKQAARNHASIIVTDPTGEIMPQAVGYMQNCGYIVKHICA